MLSTVGHSFVVAARLREWLSHFRLLHGGLHPVSDTVEECETTSHFLNDARVNFAILARRRRILFQKFSRNYLSLHRLFSQFQNDRPEAAASASGFGPNCGANWQHTSVAARNRSRDRREPGLTIR